MNREAAGVAKMFATTVGAVTPVVPGMATQEPTEVERLGAPADRPVERLDVREMGPPAPLKETLERLVELDRETVLLQVNDRAPQHLYPKLEDRGYEYATREEDAVLTAIWRP